MNYNKFIYMNMLFKYSIEGGFDSKLINID